MTNVSKNENNGPRVNKLSSLFSVTPQYIRLVLRGKRHNKAITDAYNHLVAEEKKAFRTVKMKAIKN